MKIPVVLIQSRVANDSTAEPVFRATQWRAIDISEESIEDTATTIKWDITKAINAKTVIDWKPAESILDFKKFILAVSQRQGQGAMKNAIWLSNRALDGSDYDAAQNALDVYKKTHKNTHDAKSEVSVVIQDCRIARRRGTWDPNETETLIVGAFTGQSVEDNSPAWLEIAYSYLVGALKEWSIEGQSTDEAKTFVCKGLTYLNKWKSWKTNNGESNDCAFSDYSLYGQQVKLIICDGVTEGFVEEMNKTAEQLIVAVEKGGPGAAEATQSLWRHALIVGNKNDATRWMDKAWTIYGMPKNNLPKIWKDDRSPQNFAAAMLWRSWTLKLLGKDGAKEIFDTAKIAIEGVISYPEIASWMRVVTEHFPDLLGNRL